MVKECSHMNKSYKTPTPPKILVFSLPLSGFKTVVNHVYIEKPKHIWLFLKHTLSSYLSSVSVFHICVMRIMSQS